jgi:hypothetical protein
VKLSEALAERAALQPPAIPTLNRLAAESARILQKWPDTAFDPRGDREQIIREFAERLSRNHWNGLTMARAVSAARIAFDSDFRDRDGLRRVREFLIAEIRASTKVAFLGGMCSVYVSSFVPGARHTRDLAAALMSARERLSGKWRTILAGIPQLFLPDQAPDAFAVRMTAMENPWTGLKKIGFTSPHAPGLLDAAHLAFIRKISPFLDRRVSAKKLIDWLRPPGHQSREAGATESIDALLAPWQSGSPPDEFRDFLIQSLRSLYGDPRLARGTVWDRVLPSSRTTIMRWLTGENIRFFLDVVSRVEDSHMWEPRRKFWLGLYERKMIDEAWVAFSPHATRVAREIGRKIGGEKNIAFGTQIAGGGRANTSLLILRLGRCIVVEGSHSYKVHVFKDRNPHCPKLFQREYDCDAIRSISGSETTVHNGDWQGRVLEQIEYRR